MDKCFVPRKSFFSFFFLASVTAVIRMTVPINWSESEMNSSAMRGRGGLFAWKEKGIIRTKYSQVLNTATAVHQPLIPRDTFQKRSTSYSLGAYGKPNVGWWGLLKSICATLLGEPPECSANSKRKKRKQIIKHEKKTRERQRGSGIITL